MRKDSIIYTLYSKLYFLPIIIHNYICRKSLLLPLYDSKRTIYSFQGTNTKKVVVSMVLNETTFTGGLSDRLRGIVSVYQTCKNKNLPFRIYFESLRLQDYLEPNRYDWNTDKEDICFDTNCSYPCTILTYHYNIKNRIQQFAQKHILSYYLRKKYQQIHVYSNMAIADDKYRELFHELFKPTKELQEQIDYHLNAIGGIGTYNAMVFRFRQLLGDFKEGGDILPEDEREAYIQRCLNLVESQHNLYPNTKLLITSDSITFLNRLSGYPYVYTIPGEVVHIGFTFDASKSVYMKSFIDYYMLSYAKKITLVRDSLMMHSGFALRAAMLNGAEYGEIFIG